MARLLLAVVVLTGALLGLAPVPAVRADPGDLDSSFGRDGKVTTAHGTTPMDDMGHAIVVQAGVPLGDKLVVAGYACDGIHYDFSVVRYNGDGSLDSTFGEDGKVTTDVAGANDFGYAVAIQTDGKIVVAGTADTGIDYDIAVVRYNSDGSLDSTFGGGGVVTTDIAGATDYGYTVAIQPDGKIVVAGQSGRGAQHDIAVVRYNIDGSLDTTFGGNPMMTTDIAGSSDYCYSVAIQPDGKIVVAGLTLTGGGYDIVVVRYNSDGSLDTTFDGDGKVTTDLAGSDDYGYSLAMQPDGKIVVAGRAWIGGQFDFAVVRYNSDGSLDSTFDGDGKVTTNIAGSSRYHDDGHSVAIQADGKIVVAGTADTGGQTDFALVRYNSDGSLDGALDGDGKVTTDVAGPSDYGYSVGIQLDGKIVVAGRARARKQCDLAVVRYNSDGRPDTTFGSDGAVTTNIGLKSSDSPGFAVALQTDGRVVVAGLSLTATGYDFAVVRYNSDGSLDTTFDGDAKVTTDIAGSTDVARAVAIQPDGKIVVAGTADVGGQTDFAVVRYNGDGSLDTTFDGDGRATTDISASNDYGYSVAIQSDGAIVVAGQVYDGSDCDFAVVRYESDGSLDTTFDRDGKVTTDIAGTGDYARSVAIQSDGKIVAAGRADIGFNQHFAVVRYNNDGSLDGTFDGDGKVTTGIAGYQAAGFSVAIQPNDKIVVAGCVYSGVHQDFAVVRYNSDGSLDSAFDGDGKVTTDIAGFNDYGYSVAIQWDGKIVVAGTANVGSDYDYAVVRYHSDGSLDITFDGDGKVTTDIAGSTDFGYSVAVQVDCRIVVAGAADAGSNFDVAVLRYDAELPTLITLDSFTAEAVSSSVTLAWETGTEIDNAGFNLYRARTTNGPWTKINDALIVAHGDAVSGGSYHILDTPGDGTFYYRLEDVDLNGVRVLHGPVAVKLGASFRRPQHRPTLPR